MMTIPTIYIDGTDYTFPMSLERAPEKRESDNSGYLMDKRYHSDYLGTYITYNVSVAIPKGQESEYSNLFELLSLPKQEEYTFTLPYNQGTITFDGKIQNFKDKLFIIYSEMGGGKKNIWRGISFDIVSIEPIREVEDSESYD